MKNILKDKHKTSLLLKIIAAVIILGMLFMPFAGGIKKEISGTTNSIINTYGPAFNFIFGGTLYSEHTTYINESMSIICLVGYIFMALAFILVSVSIILYLKKKDMPSNILTLIGFILLLTGSILFLASQPNIALLLSDAIMSSHSDSVTDTIQRNSSLLFGFMGPAIFGIVNSAIILLQLINDNFFLNLFRKAK